MSDPASDQYDGGRQCSILGGTQQGGETYFIHNGNVGSMIEQHPDDVRVAAHGGDHERGEAFRSTLVYVDRPSGQ